MAVAGIKISLLIPKSSPAAAMPANSETVTDKFAISSPIMMKKVVFTLKFSLIKSESPFPVTAPSLATISWTIISRIVIGISVHSIVKPKLAPATE